MATSEAIQRSPFSLAYNIDHSSQQQLRERLMHAAKGLATIATGFKVLVAGAVKQTGQFADSMDGLYQMAMQVGSSVGKIQAFGYAISQLGGDVDSANTSLANLARMIRENPGSESQIRSLGVQTHQVNGDLRDTADILSDIGARLSQLPYDQAKQDASILGIDERTLMALRQGMGAFTTQYQQMLQVAELDSDKAAEASHKLMVSLRGIGAWLNILAQTVVTNLAGDIGELLTRITADFAQNFGKIEQVAESAMRGVVLFIRAVVSVTEVISEMAAGLGNWASQLYESLGPTTQKVIELVLGVAAAMVALEAAAAFPIVAIGGLVAALALLWNDYKAWKEEGKSLIDWGRWKPEIDFATAAIKLLGDGVENGVHAFESLADSIKSALDWLKKFGRQVITLGPKWVFNGGKSVAGFYQRVSKNILGSLLGKDHDPKHKAVLKPVNQADHQGEGKPYDSGHPAAHPGSKHKAGLDDFLKSILPKENPVYGEVYDFGHSEAKSTVKHKAGQETFLKSILPVKDQDGGGIHEPRHPAADFTAKAGKSIPRGIRNNNPGNLRSGKGGSFGHYDRPIQGLRALSHQLRLYYNGRSQAAGFHRLDTIREIIGKWAPSNENNTTAYIADVAKRLGVGPDTHLDLNDLNRRIQLMQAIVLHENGSNPYSDDLYRQAAAESSITVSPKTDIHIYGGGNSRQIANEVADRQQGVMDRAIRNLRPGKAT